MSDTELRCVYGGDPFAYRLNLSVPEPAPFVTADALKRHLKRYGSDCVEQTAREAGLSESELLELGFGGSTVERVLALHEQGYVSAEIEKRLGLQRKTVRRLLSNAQAVA